MLEKSIDNLKAVDELCDRILEKQQKILSLQKEIQSLLDSGLTMRAPDLLDAPPCCASFVFDGTHHRDCRFAKSASG